MHAPRAVHACTFLNDNDDFTPSASLVPLKEGQCIHRGAWLSLTSSLSFLAKPTARQDIQISTSPDSG